MQKSFKTMQQLEEYTRGRLADAMDETYDRLLDKLMDFIEQDVYESYSPNFYERTYDLLDEDNWRVKRSNRGTKYLTRELEFVGERYTPYDLGEMTDNPRAFIHGNKNYGLFEAEDFLAMLNGKIEQGDYLNLAMVDRKPFWDDFLRYAEKYYPILFRNACKRNGIELK